MERAKKTGRSLEGGAAFVPFACVWRREGKLKIDLASEDQRIRRSALGASKKTGEKFGGGSSFRSVRLRLEKGRKAKQIPKI